VPPPALPPPVLALLAAAGFGCSAVLVRRGLFHAAPLAATLVSVVFTTLVVCGLAAATAPVSRLLTWQILPFVVAGTVTPGLSRLALFLGVHRIGVGRAMPLVSTAPAFAVFLATAALGERPSAPLLAGVAAIIVGGAMLAWRTGSDLPWRRRDLIFPLAAALGFAVRDNIFRWGFRDYEEPLLAAAAAALASLAVMGTDGTGARGTGRLRLDRAAWGFLAASGLADAVAYVLTLRAFKGGEVSVISPLVSTHGIFALALTAIFLRDLERVTWRLVTGAALIVLGSVAILRAASP